MTKAQAENKKHTHVLIELLLWMVSHYKLQITLANNRKALPLILGQANFFMEFDVCFYRSQKLFEVTPKQSL
ncbi:hypothetical protein NIES4071_15570 [Calothrix sp. NIES-4071]|nr:hypothetical protein NIES4071_15570 [Calothrix sp. NIES-4071]BAZ55894.1 hypothetical protein NIES4105_15520 [Calothrix sp. NIES-4105]